jgi:hypothetical protein
VRVLLRLDASQIDLTRKGVKRKDGDFAVMWARQYGKGRVLYNGLGHQSEAWERPEIQKMWVDQIQWALGLPPGDTTRDRPDDALVRESPMTRRLTTGTHCCVSLDPGAVRRKAFLQVRLSSYGPATSSVGVKGPDIARRP